MKINEETTVSEEQVLFNKLRYEDQQFILRQMRMLQPCEISCEIEEEKKIPEKLPDIRFENGKFYLPINDKQMYILREVDKVFLDKINSIIDYLKSKGDE